MVALRTFDDAAPPQLLKGYGSAPPFLSNVGRGWRKCNKMLMVVLMVGSIHMTQLLHYFTRQSSSKPILRTNV